MNLSFILDGIPAGHYLHTPDKTLEEFVYNATTYVNASLASLPPGVAHNLTIESYAVHLFDYAIYT